LFTFGEGIFTAYPKRAFNNAGSSKLLLARYPDAKTDASSEHDKSSLWPEAIEGWIYTFVRP
jgi:hypothetical protein